MLQVFSRNVSNVHRGAVLCTFEIKLRNLMVLKPNHRNFKDLLKMKVRVFNNIKYQANTCPNQGPSMDSISGDLTLSLKISKNKF
jgi:hypothetical protein